MVPHELLRDATMKASLTRPGNGIGEAPSSNENFLQTMRPPPSPVSVPQAASAIADMPWKLMILMRQGPHTSLPETSQSRLALR
eukprot:IDg20424t1